MRETPSGEPSPGVNIESLRRLFLGQFEIMQQFEQMLRHTSVPSQQIIEGVEQTLAALKEGVAIFHEQSMKAVQDEGTWESLLLQSGLDGERNSQSIQIELEEMYRKLQTKLYVLETLKAGYLSERN